jgi:hypothetical protein
MNKKENMRNCDLEYVLKDGKTRLNLNEKELKEYIENCLNDDLSTDESQADSKV